jgi:chromosome segregation ATPase
MSAEEEKMWPFKSRKKKIEEQIEMIRDEIAHDEHQYNGLRGSRYASPAYINGYKNKMNLLKAKLTMLESELKGLK